MLSFWFFIGIIAALLIALILLLILLRKKIFNKYDVLKYVFGIIAPFVIATIVSGCFVIADFQQDQWQYDDEIDKFYGFYEDEDGRYQSVKLFEWAAYSWDTSRNRHRPLGWAHYFAVRKPAEFENYLKTVEYYSGETVDENGVKTIKFSYLDAEWSLVRKSEKSKGYEWNNAYRKGSEVDFRTADDNLLISESYISHKKEDENGITTPLP